MKPLVTLAILAAVLSQPVLAEGQRPGPRADRMQEELQLSEEQAVKVREIMNEQHEKRRALHEGTRTKMDALHEETRAKLGKVLDEDQMNRFDEMQQQRRGKKGERRNKRADFLDELQLSGEQKTQVGRILDEQRDKMRAIRKTGGDREQMRNKMQALHEETKAELAKVLNEEQLARFEKRHQERMQQDRRYRGGTGKDTGAEKPAPQQQ
jgi:Spy/CpxP family protein refolding chaperone